MSITILTKPDISINAFRASECKELALEYIEGHTSVLTKLGVGQLSSALPNWIDNPNCIIVCAYKNGQIAGGARLQIREPHLPLPLEKALKHEIPVMATYLDSLEPAKTAEICGLWNSRSVAGYGVGSKMMVATCVALARRIQIDQVFAFCASYTKKTAEDVGFTSFSRFGCEDGFDYPTEDMRSFLMTIADVAKTDAKCAIQKEYIERLESNSVLHREEIFKGKAFNLNFCTAL